MDKEILDWIEENQPRFWVDYTVIPSRHIIEFFKKIEGSTITEKYGDCYRIKTIEGASLRGCVLKAMGQEYERDQIEDARPGPGKD